MKAYKSEFKYICDYYKNTYASSLNIVFIDKPVLVFYVLKPDYSFFTDNNKFTDMQLEETIKRVSKFDMKLENTIFSIFTFMYNNVVYIYDQIYYKNNKPVNPIIKLSQNEIDLLEAEKEIEEFLK